MTFSLFLSWSKTVTVPTIIELFQLYYVCHTQTNRGKKKECSDLMWCKQGEGWEPENASDPHSGIKTHTQAPQLNENGQVNNKERVSETFCTLVCLSRRETARKQWRPENEVFHWPAHLIFCLFVIRINISYLPNK